MSESEPTEQTSADDVEVTDGADAANVTENGESATDADAPEQAPEPEPADAGPVAETEAEGEPASEGESDEEEAAAESEAETATEAEAEAPTVIAAAVPGASEDEPATQVVATGQAAAGPGQDLGFAPVGDVPQAAAPVAQAQGQAQLQGQAQAAQAPGFAPQAPTGPLQAPQAPYGGYPAYGYGAMALGAPGQPPVDVAAKKRKRKRVLWITAAAVVLCGLIGGGVYALLPGRTGNSVVTAVTCRPSTLASCLIKAPAGAVELSGSTSDSTWPQKTVVSGNEFASQIVTDSPGVGGDAAQQLAADNVRTVVHNDWNAVDGSNVDLVVLSFDTQKDAASWNSVRSGEILAAYPGKTVAIPGDSTGAAHLAVKKDAQGDTDAAYSTVVGNLVLDVAFSSPSPFNAQDLANWAGTELASLHTAPAPPADPAPTAPGTQQVACQSRLTSCLMSTPDGGESWTQPTDPHWVSSTWLSPAQFVHMFWDGDSASIQSEVLADFTADGVTGIVHKDWTLDDADLQGDVYVIQAITETGADQLASEHLGEPQWSKGQSGVSYTVPGVSGVQAYYTSKPDSNGFTDYTYTQTDGNVIAFGWLYFYGSFESSYANSWTKAATDAVSSTVQTEPMGMFPLNAPTLAAPAQGACASSGDCLIPLPGGAQDTTSTSYDGSAGLSAAEYASNYETSVSNEMGSWLSFDGFRSGEHRSWSASNGATADAVLLKFATPAQAKAAALFEYGNNAPSDRVCTDAAVPDALCLASPVSVSDMLQKEVVWVLAWKGDYEVGVQVTLSDSADLSQAYGWAQQQLDMLPAN
jgi:hypothetical protein